MRDIQFAGVYIAKGKDPPILSQRTIQSNVLVLPAYGFSPAADLCEKLLALNLALAEKEKNGKAVVEP